MQKEGDGQIGEVEVLAHVDEHELVIKDLHGEVRNRHDVRRVCHIIMLSVFTTSFGIYRFTSN
jgi:hypothetical protein